MSKLNSFKLPEKRKSRTRVGRGNGSKGTYSGRGLKGQKSRSGGGVPLFFEGGQLPLVKRLPFLRGFKNRFKKDFSIVNLLDIENKFNEGDEVNAESLFNHNLIRKKSSNVKILGNGNLKKSLKIKVHAVTKSAEEKIKKSGSTIELLNEIITENKD
ncbi:MAG: 50S ribosomal protein L15 [Alphaproteobacteria bacterium]|jgi:large subunit ribosomal protein L15|nr:MAG: 50S ribosomal protein L15 [Alphaproteobacteria bacterium]|tara:strand:- start:6 stop:476 length:471 start_codon:yes stop_codon:yes gene_type:complete